MKRVVLLCFLLAFLLLVTGCAQIRIPKGERAVLTYDPPVMGDSLRVVETLTAEESATVRRILMDAKRMDGADGASFTKAVSLSFGERVFAVAYRGGEAVWDVQNDQYYAIDKADWEEILALFKRYGIIL